VNKNTFYHDALKDRENFLSGIYYYYFKIEFLFCFIEQLEKKERGEIKAISPSLNLNKDNGKSFTFVIIEYETKDDIDDLLNRYKHFKVNNGFGEAIIKIKSAKNNRLCIKIINYELKGVAKEIEDKHFTR